MTRVPIAKKYVKKTYELRPGITISDMYTYLNEPNHTNHYLTFHFGELRITLWPGLYINAMTHILRYDSDWAEFGLPQSYKFGQQLSFKDFETFADKATRVTHVCPDGYTSKCPDKTMFKSKRMEPIDENLDWISMVTDFIKKRNVARIFNRNIEPDDEDTQQKIYYRVTGHQFRDDKREFIFFYNKEIAIVSAESLPFTENDEYPENKYIKQMIKNEL